MSIGDHFTAPKRPRSRAKLRAVPKSKPTPALPADLDPFADPFALPAEPASPSASEPAPAAEPQPTRCTIGNDPFGLPISLPLVIVERAYDRRYRVIVLDTDGETATRENVTARLAETAEQVAMRLADRTAVERDIAVLDEPATDRMVDVLTATINATIAALAARAVS